MIRTGIIVVGGGAIGLSAAWELSRRGRKVTLIDRDAVGKSTSWSAAGILPPANFATATDPIDQLRGLSHDLYPRWADQLKALTGVDPGFRRCGAWYLADTPGERAAMVGMRDYWSEQQIECHQVSREVLASREPMLEQVVEASRELAAWWVPNECQIRCPRYLQALAAACRHGGVEVIQRRNVLDVVGDGTQATVKTVATSDQQGRQDYVADAVVLCAGTWSGRIAAELRLQKSLVPVRGQMLLLKAEQPIFQSIVNVGHRYLVPRDDGHVLVGSCEEEVGFHSSTTAAMIDGLRDFALQICPQLADAREVTTWSGLRPMTFDGFPMIGQVPEMSNVFIAAGHFRSGIHLSPGTAVVLADLMTGKTPAVSLDAFRVGKQQSPADTDARTSN